MSYNFNTKINKIIYKSVDNDWCCLSVDNTIKDKTFKEDTLIVTGNFQGIYQDCDINIIGEATTHIKYGAQIACKNYKILVNKLDKEQIINFLSKSSIKGIDIQNALKIHKAFKEYSIDIVLNNTDKLLEIKGIGIKTLEKVKSSVERYKEMEDLINYGLELGLNYNTINKIYNSIGKNSINILKENIYKILDYTDLISFKQLDAIALNNGIKTDDSNRIKYGFLYTLKNRVTFEGCTGCRMQQFKDEVSKELGTNDINIFYNALNILEEENKIILKNNIIYYKEYYDIEKNISDKIKQLAENNKSIKISEENITEEINNFPFKLNEQQINAIRNSLKNNISIITGAGGCVDEETEFLTINGWKKIKDYKDKELIAIYNKDGGINFNYPKNYIKVPATEWFHMFNEASIDQKLSGEHILPYITKRNNNFKTKFMEDIYNISKKIVQFRGKFITNFNTNFERKIKYSEIKLRILSAVLLKGKIEKIYKDNTIDCVVKLINEKDQVYLEKLLRKSKIKYTTKTTIEYKNKYKNKISFYFKMKKNYYKNFPESFYTLNKEQLKIIFNEVLYWGNRNNPKSYIAFTTKDKKIADYIQYLVTVNGYRSIILKKGNVYKIHKCKTILVGLNKNRGYGGLKTTIEKVQPKENEYKYCFEVSSGFWISRRNNKIMVSGNSGKSSSLKALANIYYKEGYNVKLLSPTGKASRRLEECTGRLAKTIHKYLMELRFLGNEKISKKTVLIIDEASMLDILILNELLDYIETDTRIVFIGDVNQLPSVQAGNFLEDLMTYDKVSTNILTDIMRQSKNSNIIKYCNKVNEGITFKVCNYKDFIYKSYSNSDLLLEDFYLALDKELINNTIDNVQIITPYKKGDIGVNKINSYIRNNYNENVLDERYNYKINDKIMHIKNNYKKGVFNGEVGRVTCIDNEEDYLEVTYDNGKIIYEIDDIDETILSYVCTIHKVQGSEYPTVFLLLDNNNKLLLYRKLLYTAMSRAREKLYIMSIEDAVNKCIENNYFKPRITYLSNFLNS